MEYRFYEDSRGRILHYSNFMNFNGYRAIVNNKVVEYTIEEANKLLDNKRGKEGIRKAIIEKAYGE